MAAQARHPISLRVSVTHRCQLSCQYCMPREGMVPLRPMEILSFEEIQSFVASLGQQFDLEKVRVTGGEPLLRRDVDTLIAMLSSLGIPDIAITTNGQLLARWAAVLKRAGLARVNVSLDSLNPQTFSRLTGGGSMDMTKSGIKTALRQGLKPVKLNMVVMRGVNDSEVADVLSFALDRGCEMRFLELMPIGVARAGFGKLYVSSGEVRRALEGPFTLEALVSAPGATSKNYRVRTASGKEGVVGFISPHSSPFCKDCNRLRLTADGYLMGCLAHDDGVDIRPFLSMDNARAQEELKRAVESVFPGKRNGSAFENRQPMAAVGG